MFLVLLELQRAVEAACSKLALEAAEPQTRKLACSARNLLRRLSEIPHSWWRESGRAGIARSRARNTKGSKLLDSHHRVGCPGLQLLHVHAVCGIHYYAGRM